MNDLIVLTTQTQIETVCRKFTNKPEVRHTNILNLLRSLNCHINITNNVILTIDILYELNVHDIDMINYLKNCFESFDEFSDRGFNEYFKDGIIPYTIPHYKVNKSKLSRLKYWQQAGAFCNDMITPIFEDTWKNSIESANNCYLVKDYIKVSTFQTIYCLNLYPGHHAGYSNYGGYCFLNNSAICAQTLLMYKICNKIAILDLDHHAGDGTSDIFKNNQFVTTVSIHANTDYDYPYYSSNDENSDEYIRNKFITFEPNCTIEKYREHLRVATDYICQDMPDALIIAFGGDTYKNDPDASIFCKCLLDLPDYEIIGRQIRSTFGEIPIIITQEGGYSMENIADIIKNFLLGIC